MPPKTRGRGRGKAIYIPKKEEEEEGGQPSNQKDTLSISRAPTDNKQQEINSGLATSKAETDDPRPIQEKPSFQAFYPYLIPVLLVLLGIWWMRSQMFYLEKDIKQLKNVTGSRDIVDEAQQKQLKEIKLVINQIEQKQKVAITEPSIKATIVAHGEIATDVLHGDSYRIVNFVLNGIGSWIGVHPLADDIILRGEAIPDRCLLVKNEDAYIQIRLERPGIVKAIAIEQPPKILLQNFDSSPKQFEVLGGMESGPWIDLGKGQYQLHDNPYQIFPLAHYKVKQIKLVILSNYGHSNFSSLYNVRVYGT